MSDWDFLHDMHDRDYSAEEIADAAAVGYAPWDEEHISRQWIKDELKGLPPDDVRLFRSAEPFRSKDGYPCSTRE